MSCNIKLHYCTGSSLTVFFCAWDLWDLVSDCKWYGVLKVAADTWSQCNQEANSAAKKNMWYDFVYARELFKCKESPILFYCESEQKANNHIE